MNNRLPVSVTSVWLAAFLAGCSGGGSDDGAEAGTGGAGAGTGGAVTLATGGSTSFATGGMSPVASGGAASAVTGGAGPAPTGGTSSAPAGGTGSTATGGTSALVAGGTSSAITGGSSGVGTGGASVGMGGTSSIATGGRGPAVGTGGASQQTTEATPDTGTGGAEADGTGGDTAAGGTGGVQDGSGGFGTSGSTGVATGGATGDPPATPEPSLITSAEGSYWQVGEVAEVSGGTATLTVNANSTKQEWIGFGGTFNEAGWDVLLLLTEAERLDAIKLLFDAQDGANFAWGRIPIGASDYAMDRYSLNDNSGDYAMEQFSIERDRELLIPYIKAAVGVKPNLRLWGSPWSPPSWMKVNETYGEMNGGRISEDQQVLEAYALYLSRFVEEYAAEGLVMDHIHPQNEPGYETRYPSCLWTADLLKSFVTDYLGPTLAQRSPSTEIWFGTLSAPEDTAHLSAVLNDPEALGYIKGFGLQWNTIDSVATAAATGLPVLQTEHKCGNYHWLDTFNPDRPPNDHAYAEESWGLIRDWINKGVNAYSAWNMVLDTVGKNLDYQRPWPQNALLTVDRSSRKLTPTPAYFVFRHLSQYVDPGALVLGTTGSADALAFKNPDGSIVTVVYNSGSQASPITLSVGGATLQFEVPARGWATVNRQATPS